MSTLSNSTETIFIGETYIDSKASVRYQYEPLPDITAYELALLMPYLLGRRLLSEDVEQLGTTMRHLKKI